MKILLPNRCAILWCAPFRKIWCPPDGIKDVEYPLSSDLWDYNSNGSRWVHTISIIDITPESDSSDFSTSLQTTKGYFFINVSPSVNGSTRLVGVNECFVWTHSSYCELFIPFSYKRQIYMSHTRKVGVRLFIHHQWLRGIFTKRSVQ